MRDDENDKIDFRSDTVTKPTPPMREAIANAEVGDDVLGDEPTVQRLEARMAELLGKEATLFVPSGSMANLLAIRSQTNHGEEILAHEYSHVYQYEAGSFAAVSGCSIRFLPGERGQFEEDVIESAIRPNDAHFPKSRLLVVENTQNKGGGSVWPIDRVKRVTTKAREFGLSCHLDGARLMNACVEVGCDPKEYTQYFDTVSMCFSKGLGAPVGSIVAGTREIIGRTHRFRKMFGGAMRQSGVLAAAALYALDHHVERLAEDHANARRLGAALGELPGISIDLDTVETNILYFDVDSTVHGGAGEFSRRLDEAGVRMLATGTRQIRAVTHLDAAGEKIDRAIEILRRELAT